MKELVEAFAEQDERFAPAWNVLTEAIGRQVFPGAAAAVTCRGRLVALRGVGRFTYDAGAPAVGADTVFDLASLTKVVATTLAAMVLWERARLPLEMPLVEAVPEFAEPAAGDVDKGARRAVTLEHLLAHNSGLPAYVKLYERAEGHRAMVQAACGVPLGARPGERAEYSDIGFLLLGEVLARIAGERLGEFCKREVFQPLGMNRTGWRNVHLPGMRHDGLPEARDLRGAYLGHPDDREIPPTETDAGGHLIQGFVQDENARAFAGPDDEADAGHAGVFAPAREVALVAECMLRGGTPLVKPETVERFTRRAAEPPGTSRALGWDTPSFPSQSGAFFTPGSFGHLGYAGTSVWIDPGRQVSIVLLTNRTWPDRGNDEIKRVRPRFHDAVAECLRWRAQADKMTDKKKKAR